MNAPGEEFFILSMERTAGEPACVWWRPKAAGYTRSLAEAGRYSREQAIRHSDPPYHLAIPCDAVEVPSSKAKALAKKALRESRFDAHPTMRNATPAEGAPQTPQSQGRPHVADRLGQRCEVCGVVLLGIESVPIELRGCPGSDDPVRP